MNREETTFAETPSYHVESRAHRSSLHFGIDEKRRLNQRRGMWTATWGASVIALCYALLPPLHSWVRKEPSCYIWPLAHAA
jgi:hypothetical protein